MQFKIEDRAAFGKGLCKLRKEFEKYYVNDLN